jgi:hypothetical protein
MPWQQHNAVAQQLFAVQCRQQSNAGNKLKAVCAGTTEATTRTMQYSKGQQKLQAYSEKRTSLVRLPEGTWAMFVAFTSKQTCHTEYSFNEAANSVPKHAAWHAVQG